jgi:hypothetical protein
VHNKRLASGQHHTTLATTQTAPHGQDFPSKRTARPMPAVEQISDSLASLHNIVKKRNFYIAETQRRLSGCYGFSGRSRESFATSSASSRLRLKPTFFLCRRPGASAAIGARARLGRSVFSEQSQPVPTRCTSQTGMGSFSSQVRGSPPPAFFSLALNT